MSERSCGSLRDDENEYQASCVDISQERGEANTYVDMRARQVAALLREPLECLKLLKCMPLEIVQMLLLTLISSRTSWRGSRTAHQKASIPRDV